MEESNRKINSSIIRKSVNAKIRRDITFDNSFIWGKRMDRFLNILSDDKDRNLFFGAHFWYLTTKIMLQKIESSSTWKHIKQIKHEKRKSRSYRS